MNLDRFACKAKDVYGGWVQSDIFESVNGTGFGFATIQCRQIAAHHESV